MVKIFYGQILMRPDVDIYVIYVLIIIDTFVSSFNLK